MRSDFGEAVQDSPGHVQSRGDLRQSRGDRRSDDSGETVDDFEQCGGLREDERLLDGGVDGLVAGLSESRDGEVEDLEPAEEKCPVVESEVDSSDGGGYSGHRKKWNPRSGRFCWGERFGDLSVVECCRFGKLEI